MLISKNKKSRHCKYILHFYSLKDDSSMKGHLKSDIGQFDFVLTCSDICSE